MNLHYLRVFHEVAEAGSVTRAAERLRISQPAVSVQVKRLEAEVGLQLLRAEGRGVRLTEEGQTLAAYARRLFALEAEIEAQVENLREGRVGRLRIGATNLPANYLLPELAARFKRSQPGVSVQVQTGNSRTIFAKLLEYELDVALMAGGWDEPGVWREVVLRDELWFLVPPGHALAGKEARLEEVAEEPFLLREEGSSTRERLLALFEMRGWRLQVGLEFAGLLETLKGVEAGYGVTVAPSRAVREAVRRGELGRVRVVDAELPFLVHLCGREREEMSAVARLFAGSVREAFVGGE